jgi:hypothetical protein
MVPDAGGPGRMLDVEAYGEIRRKVEIEGLSRREAARKPGHSRKTVDIVSKIIWSFLMPKKNFLAEGKDRS